MNVTCFFCSRATVLVLLLPCRYCSKPHNPYSTGVFQHTRPPRRGAFFGAVVLAVFSAVEGASTDNASHKLCGLPTSAARDPDHADVVAYDPNPNLASPTMPPPVPAFKTQVALQ
ncbi:hypothetical protein EDB85DRAFT_1892827 [Lactarius pseudohatsudake]|nr:hypothetical protein EDB85DRAFT_1892827 [Lactarius pseudohatsudake]